MPEGSASFIKDSHDSFERPKVWAEVRYTYKVGFYTKKTEYMGCCFGLFGAQVSSTFN